MEVTATSSMVVDLSGDNDTAGALAAAANIPTVSPDSPFERSCDNPECSAPKLISLVPKRETPEFITEPMIMTQPTLINGFTTVFQIDGIGAKMNDIMYGDQNGNSSTKPKSVFRIVPNTHAHIVNYVVVDGAGETMRKIKRNDTDTMRKLLDSQRLSAEQMLKKLIGKAFKAPSQPQVPLPINNKMQMSSPQTTPVPIPVPVANTLPTVPSGITITPLPLADAKQAGTSTPTTATLTPTASGIASKSTTSIATTSPTITTTSTTTAPSKKETPKPTTPSATSVTTVTTATTASTTSTSKVSKATTSTSTVAGHTPILRRVLDTKTAEETTSTSPSTPVLRHGRPNILKRKLATTTPEPETIKRLRPRSPKPKSQTPLATSLKKTKPVTPPPTRKLPTLPKLPTKPPTPAVVQPTPQTRKSTGNVFLTKSAAKEDELLEEGEIRRSSEGSANKTGLKRTKSVTPPPPRKLPTLPKLPTKPPTPAVVQSTPQTRKSTGNMFLTKSATEDDELLEEGEIRTSSTSKGNETSKPKLGEGSTVRTNPPSSNKPGPLPTRKLLVASKATKEHSPGATTKADSSALICHETLPVKTKPLMGPASKMNALRAIAAAKAAVAHVTKAEQLSSKSSKPSVTRLGETLITSTASLTKPCSVTIEKADIPINIIIKPKEPIITERIEISSSDSNSDSEPHTAPIKVPADLSSKPDTASTPKLAWGVDSKTPTSTALKTNAGKAGLTVVAGLTSKPSPTLVSGTLATLRARVAAAACKANQLAKKKRSIEQDPLALSEASTSEGNGGPTTPKIAEAPIAKANVTSNAPKAGEGPNSRKLLLTKPTAAKVSAAPLQKADGSSSGISKSTSDGQLKPKTTLPTVASSPKLDTQSATKTNLLPTKPVAATSKPEQLPTKVTRSSTPKVSSDVSSKVNETPTRSSSPLARTLKVKLPTLKSGVMTIPLRSPHPNLKIASVISGGSAVAAATSFSKQSATKIVLEESSGSDIEKLQQELAALRRTVARLTKKKM